LRIKNNFDSIATIDANMMAHKGVDIVWVFGADRGLELICLPYFGVIVSLYPQPAPALDNELLNLTDTHENIGMDQNPVRRRINDVIVIEQLDALIGAWCIGELHSLETRDEFFVTTENDCERYFFWKTTHYLR
jgi:hypothetical protein